MKAENPRAPIARANSSIQAPKACIQNGERLFDVAAAFLIGPSTLQGGKFVDHSGLAFLKVRYCP